MKIDVTDNLVVRRQLSFAIEVDLSNEVIGFLKRLCDVVNNSLRHHHHLRSSKGSECRW